ncbi:hypothetical protein Zmor_013755 [Zophobas morio]|uniref:Uncharacterized protein n=1 Tax=Zophobas morio TaxID=2755281 RepID=A0AA38MFF7_9CUCU|nr:hypothetical protein Zmor_013755 [Zophobas morio]
MLALKISNLKNSCTRRHRNHSIVQTSNLRLPECVIPAPTPQKTGTIQFTSINKINQDPAILVIGNPSVSVNNERKQPTNNDLDLELRQE